MGKPIKMGNDEFILYCRKQHKGENKSTAQLGKLIWEWIRDYADGKKVGKRENCEWVRKRIVYLQQVFRTQLRNLNLTETCFLLYMTISIHYNL